MIKHSKHFNKETRMMYWGFYIKTEERNTLSFEKFCRQLKACEMIVDEMIKQMETLI